MKELSPGSFVFEIPKALPSELCDQIIYRFEADSRRQAGVVGTHQVEKHIKDTTDLLLSPHKNWEDIDQQLFENLGFHLRMLLPHLEKNLIKIQIDCDSGYNIQKYETGKGYTWHVDHLYTPEKIRQLVFIYYLNDVDGGTTDFFNQGISVQPEKGKLVFFPPFWTHIHRSAPVLSGVKYIVTGWLEARSMPH